MPPAPLRRDGGRGAWGTRRARHVSLRDAPPGALERNRSGGFEAARRTYFNCDIIKDGVARGMTQHVSSWLLEDFDLETAKPQRVPDIINNSLLGVVIDFLSIV